MRFLQLGRLAVAAALVALATTPLARADTVRDWNLNAANALINAATAPIPGAGYTPPVAILHLAMVQGAVYDAVNAIAGGYQPYLVGPHASPSCSQDAAAATAAHHVLVGLVPQLSQTIRDRLDLLYAQTLAGIPNGHDKDCGIAVGAEAAAAMLHARTNDGRFVPFSFAVGTLPGQWRPVPPLFINDPFAWVGNVRPFLLHSADQVRTAGPNPLTSHAYAVEFNEVKELGAATGSKRTPEQTAVALFYVEHAAGLWNRTFRAIAEQQGLTQAQEARLFAMQNLAGADSLIGCWRDKAYWGFWRPITAIQLADTDGNPLTEPDPHWTSLIATPPYPDHPSGYNCISSAFLNTAKTFFGTDVLTFSVFSSSTNTTRDYHRFSSAIADVIDARVWNGLHFRTADVQAAELGRDVVRWLKRNYFQPTH